MLKLESYEYVLLGQMIVCSFYEKTPIYAMFIAHRMYVSSEGLSSSFLGDVFLLQR